MSEGVVSGVHWILAKESDRESDRAFASEVFPTPGTSSRSRWPPARRVMITLSMTSPFPTIRSSMHAIGAASSSGRYFKNSSFSDEFLLVPLPARPSESVPTMHFFMMRLSSTIPCGKYKLPTSFSHRAPTSSPPLSAPNPYSPHTHPTPNNSSAYSSYSTPYPRHPSAAR